MEVSFLRTNQALVGFKQDCLGSSLCYSRFSGTTFNNVIRFQWSFHFNHHRFLQHRFRILVTLVFVAIIAFKGIGIGYWILSVFVAIIAFYGIGIGYWILLVFVAIIAFYSIGIG
jgi:hypothetical protein